MNSTKPTSRSIKKLFQFYLIAAFLPLLLFVTPLVIESNWWISGYDWLLCLRPASLALLHGQSPYQYAVYNPPWIFVLLSPIALLPDKYSFAVMVLLAYLPYALVAHRLKVDKINLLIFLANPALLHELMEGNIDWIVPLGLALPHQIGLFFVLAKPQIGAGVALFWLVEAYRSGGIKQVVKTFLPVSIAFALSFAVYGFYMFRGTEVIGKEWNTSLFPYSIPLGLFLLYYSLKKRDVLPALSSTIFLTPYFAPQSLSVPIFGAVKSRWILIGAVVAAWLIWIFLL